MKYPFVAIALAKRKDSDEVAQLNRKIITNDNEHQSFLLENMNNDVRYFDLNAKEWDDFNDKSLKK